MLIEAEKLSKKFGKRYAIRDISFGIEGGKVAIMGYNGAGKSTLVKLICGILRPTSGKISVLGRNPAASPEVRREIGVASHNPMLYRELTVKENLEFFSKLYGTEFESDLAEMLGFREYLNRRVFELSRGYLQRVSFARALINSPKLLVLDEVTSGLDQAVRENILEILEGYRGCVLFTTHVLDEAEFCDSFIVLKNGKIAYFGKNYEEAVGILNEGNRDY
ncbi:ABC transporter ATP-binding protein [Archaeoglobus neptunius]|uniref:ABC transporter ATP-binding protein n=1 Tax=Archaeoglobus neptunius TaxID=2798580 RepID=UPI0019289705|nr:ABC transporter ATP-binding protein [Archaeoglobus neptunius]